MADTKISALPTATTPLAGTEVLPIVQSGATKQVSVDNLTSGRTVAASTVNVDANSASPAVRITQTGAGAALLVEDSSSTDATPFVIDTSGNVGIGNPTPTNKVSVYDATSAIVASEGDTTAQLLVHRASTNTSPSNVIMKKSRGTVASPTAVASGDIMGAVTFQAYGGSNTQTLALIRGVVGTYTSDTNMSSFMSFLTAPGGNVTATEKMRITADGKLLIGTTTSGASKLTVSDDSIQVNTSKTPASATDTGTTGQICWDSSYIYVCVATNTWKRAAISTW